MTKSFRRITASIGVIVFFQIAPAQIVPAMAADHSANFGRLAQAAEPAASATAPASEAKAPDPSPSATSPPSNPTSTATVVKPGPSAAGCGLKYLTAEVSGKLKGRKWKEFREQECGPTTSQAVFPTAIAPKYSHGDPGQGADAYLCGPVHRQQGHQCQ
ncbi:MAG: hypothetical protein WDN50_17330 [Bradyrhizobium sp.]